MRLGQTSVIHFLSNLLASVLGFIATIYIARMLGSEPLGVYNVAIGLVSWLSIAGRIGVSKAISKRVSEGVEEGAYATAGLIVILGLFALVATGLLIFRGPVVDYIGYPAVEYITLILLFLLLNALINALLVGLHLVHVSGFLSPVRTGSRALGQITLVATGASTAGLFIGHIAGFGVAVLVGSYFILRQLPQLSRPKRRHFESLTNFAKFSWLGSLQSKMFSYTDILVLGVFVSTGLIGIYAVAWNIAQFLILFSGTLQSTLFPEMSAISKEKEPQAVARIIEQSLSFGGLFLIPGLFGGALLGERILRIYGPEFPKGATVLTILITANLLMGYQNQLLNALNAIDRPDLAFRTNVMFIAINVTLNAVLIYSYGWIGAAIATTASVAVTIVPAYGYVSGIINFDIPISEIGKQWLAATLMAGVVFVGLEVENTYGLLGHNIATVLVLVGIGASVYFIGLLGLSKEFRETVKQNTPFEMPDLS